MNLSKLAGVIPQPVIDQIPAVSSSFDINTPIRLAHFLAQCGHESAGFKFVLENLNYSAEGLRKIFPKYFTPELAQEYARKPEKIANRVYANRMENGPEESGDGWKFRGRGYIQLTGKINYSKFDTFVPEDILANPDLVATKYPLLSAAWFWHTNNLNSLADRGPGDDIVTLITRRVNGGTHGLADRLLKFKQYYPLIG